jgi:hypothetical protein
MGVVGAVASVAARVIPMAVRIVSTAARVGTSVARVGTSAARVATSAVSRTASSVARVGTSASTRVGSVAGRTATSAAKSNTSMLSTAGNFLSSLPSKTANYVKQNPINTAFTALGTAAGIYNYTHPNGSTSQVSVDPASGQPINPQTGETLDPNAGYMFDANGQAIDMNGLIIPGLTAAKTPSTLPPAYRGSPFQLPGSPGGFQVNGPAAQQASGVDSILGWMTNQMNATNQLTDDEVENGDIYRTKAREEVLKETEYAHSYVANLNDRNIGITEFDTLPYTSFLDAELLWWNNHPELSPRQVRNRWIMYGETLEVLKANLQNTVSAKTIEAAVAAPDQEARDTIIGQMDDPVIKGKDAFINQSSDSNPQEIVRQQVALRVKQQKAKEDEEAQQNTLSTLNRTIWLDAVEAFGASLSIVFSVLYFLFAIRIAAFGANQYLYKPVSYRALAFLYTFLFAPIFGIYYIWRTIAHYFFKKPLPPYYSIFPAVPYPAGEKLNLQKSIYGYPETPELIRWIKEMKEAQFKDRIRALEPVFF